MEQSKRQGDLPLVHVYQNTEEGHLIFYSMKDKLFFYTLLASMLRRYGKRVVAMSLMPDHYHLLIPASSGIELRPLLRDLNSIYAKDFNREAGTCGKIFKQPIGLSVKTGIKERMSAINYVHNNPVVKKLDRDCAQSTWNFLAYAKSANPFSDKILRKKSRRALRRSLGIVDSLENRGEWLGYPTLDRLFDPLHSEEKMQLFDYIVTKYHAIDYEAAAAYFGSVDGMISAARINSGSEYDINEVFDTRDDRPYLRMAAALIDEGICTKDVKEVLSLPYGTRLDLLTLLRARSLATFRQMEKFLHLHEGTMKAKKDAANILVLTGFMGSGKTTAGRELARSLGCPFLDLDEEVQKAAGKSIPRIFQEDGEPAFRKQEFRTLQKTFKSAHKSASHDNKAWDLVLALGGGTIMRSQARSLLEGRCFLVYLKASLETLQKNLAGQTADRPLLAGKVASTRKGFAIRKNSPAARMASLLSKREAVYNVAGDLTVETDRKGVKGIVNAIERELTAQNRP